MGAMQKIGRYQITRELGRGAMGVVYHAIDPIIGRPVAIKTLRLRDVDDGEQRLRLRERLFREARSAGALSHPGIVTIYDMDEADGLAYIAMEFVDGETLEDIMARPNALTRDRLNEILRQAAAALDYAHRKGIIHRDIKPANVMIDTTGAVKITDFGIAKIAQLEGQTLTGVLVGTPNYMSPEQVQGLEIDGRSDQFSLGVIAYEMLTGERPFFGEQISTVVYKIVADQPVPAQNVNSSLNDGVDKMLRRALAKKPEKRFANCTVFVTGLETALNNTKSWRILPRKAHQNIPTASTDAVTRTFRPLKKPSPEAKVVQPKEKRRSWLLPFFGAFLFLLAILAAVAWQAGMLEIPGLPEPKEARASSETTAQEQTPPEQAQATPPRVDDADTQSKSDTLPANDTPPAPASIPKATGTVTSNSAPPNAIPANATFQEVQVMTDPAGSVATLDGQSDSTCQTPCKLRARSGTHSLTVTREGYQTESREVHVEHDDIDVPLISLTSANGMLLLTSDPTAAHVWVDGKPTDYLTPVRISLPAGNHSVAIQKDNLRSSGAVEIRNGALSTLKLGAVRQYQ